MRSEYVLYLSTCIAIGCSGSDSAAISKGVLEPSSGGAAPMLGSGGAGAGIVSTGGATGTSLPPTMAGGASSAGSPAIPPASGGAAPQMAGGAGGSAPPATSAAAGGSSNAPPPVTTTGAAGYPYDTSVRFDWPETSPMAGHCDPGTYAGNFSCDLSNGLGLFTISGPVTFTLAPSMSGEFLTITGGMLKMDTQLGGGDFPAMASLSGQLDCDKNELDAKLDNGVGVSVVPFTGTMTGQLDRLTGTITGTWKLAEGTDPTAPSLLSCTGTWSTSKQ